MNRILIAEHHHLVREGISRLLEGEPAMVLCRPAAHTDALLAGLRECRPRVVLLDLHLPPAGGLEALRRVLRAQPRVRVICMGLTRHAPWPARLLEQGAAGVLTLGCTRDELLESIRCVARGQVFVSAELARALVQSRLAPGREPVSDLSPRELAVMKMVSEGRPPKEISDQLCISPKTVSTYRSRVCRKLGVANDVQLTHLSLQHGLIEYRYCS